jgi:hypothetical protein
MTKEEAKYISQGTKVISTDGKICGIIEVHPVRNRFTGRIDRYERCVRMPSEQQHHWNRSIKILL